MQRFSQHEQSGTFDFKRELVRSAGGLFRGQSRFFIISQGALGVCLKIMFAIGKNITEYSLDGDRGRSVGHLVEGCSGTLNQCILKI